MFAKQLAALKIRARELPAKQAIPDTSSFNESQSNSNEPKSTVYEEPQCICNRQLQDILCRSCGYCFVGRMRKKCPAHANEILLMDAACCPKCMTVYLMEIKTSSTPVKNTQREVEEELKSWRQRRHSGVVAHLHKEKESWDTIDVGDVEAKLPDQEVRFDKNSLGGQKNTSLGGQKNTSLGGQTLQMEVKESDESQRLGKARPVKESLSERFARSSVVSQISRSDSADVRSTAITKPKSCVTVGEKELPGEKDTWENGILIDALKRRMVREWEEKRSGINDLCFGEKR